MTKPILQKTPDASTARPAPPKRKPGWRVILGRLAWARYTYERAPGDELTLLGSVSKGMQVGALAMTADEQYVQVVGDHITPLNTREMTKAIANAPKDPGALRPEFSKDPESRFAPKKNAPAPVVIVKKRRVAVMP